MHVLYIQYVEQYNMKFAEKINVWKIPNHIIIKTVSNPKNLCYTNQF